jgi:DNA-binding NtrC family response regulator
MMAAMAEETRTASAGATLFHLQSGTVRVIDGADRGKTWTITDTPICIGSADTCEITLRDSRVSRRHCRITLVAHGFLVEDLESRNGTYFEGSRVGQIAVPPGAILRVGKTHLAVGGTRDTATIEPSTRTQLGSLVGHSLVMRRTFALLERAAASDVTVLLEGETGTGKDGAAHAIHALGARARGPFEVLDCAAQVPALLASELHGHQRGAFTGATADRAGVFERANGGTVFLDEIGELPLDLQPALLRVLETSTVTRLGSHTPLRADVRVIAATHRDLAEAVVAGTFREDLYYRLQVLPITMPPLRQRRDDLPALCTALLREHGVDAGPIDGPRLAALAEHRWPGNVRELRNVIERALVRAGGHAPFAQLVFELGERDVGEALARGGGDSFQERKREAIDRFERDYLVELLREHAGNVKQASRASGIERTQLKRLLRKHALK